MTHLDGDALAGTFADTLGIEITAPTGRCGSCHRIFELAAEGTVGIIGNLFGFDHEPTPQELARQVGPHSLRPLLDKDDNCKMLVINGTADALVPIEDSLVFSGRRDTLVVMAEGETHCVVTKWDDTIALITGWLAREVG
jgi:esterase FrsA